MSADHSLPHWATTGRVVQGARAWPVCAVCGRRVRPKLDVPLSGPSIVANVCECTS